MEGLRGGDPEIFDEVYEAYRGRVFGYLLRMSRDRALAEDLLQETWLRVAKSAARLAEDTRLEPWLFRIAHNLFVSHRRWAALDMARITALSAAPRGRAAPSTPFEATSAHDLQRRLESAFSRLALRHREILALVGVEGLGRLGHQLDRPPWEWVFPLDRIDHHGGGGGGLRRGRCGGGDIDIARTTERHGQRDQADHDDRAPDDRPSGQSGTTTLRGLG